MPSQIGEKVFRLVVIMNFYPLTAKEPANLLQVADRVHELSYGNRLRQDCRSAERINKLVGTIDDLQKVVEAAQLRLKPKLREALAALQRYKQVTTVQIDLQASGDAQPVEDDFGRTARLLRPDRTEATATRTRTRVRRIDRINLKSIIFCPAFSRP